MRIAVVFLALWTITVTVYMAITNKRLERLTTRLLIDERTIDTLVNVMQGEHK